MKNKKQLRKLVQKMVEASIKDGILQDKKVTFFLKEIKKLSLATSIFILSEYKKRLLFELSKHTLVVESAMDVNILELNKIKEELKGFGRIVKTEVKINPELIGGLRVKLGDIIFDDSIKSRIAQIGGMIHG